MNMADYRIQHWTSGQTVSNGESGSTLTISVNDRAATRQAIINRVRQRGLNLVERSDWSAHKNRSERMRDDWDYSMIAIHNAGRSFSCGPAALQLQDIQHMQMNKKLNPFDDIGYHYALDCLGNVYEGRDIRFKGEHLYKYNTGAIGILLLENLTEAGEGEDHLAKFLKPLNAVGLKNTPTINARQKKSLTIFLSILREFFYIRTLGGHREFPRQDEQRGEGKICPGNVGIAAVKELRKSTGLSAP